MAGVIAQQTFRRQWHQCTATTSAVHSILRTRTALPRRVVRPHVRLNSTKSSGRVGSSTDSESSPLIAGAIGGLVTLVGGYAWYHFSGTKKVVQTARSTIETMEAAKQKVSEKTPSPFEAMGFIRSTTQSYLSSIPGAGPAVNAAFQELDKLSESHGEEVNKILLETYQELRGVIDNGGFDRKTGEQVTDILKRRAKQMKELSKDAGHKILEDNPKLKEQVGNGVDQLRQLGKTYGPEAQRVVDETYSQVQDILAQGMTPQGVYRATNLVQDKIKEVKQMGKKAAETAWNEGSKEMQQYMDKLPSGVRGVLDDNMQSLKDLALSGGISTSMIPQIFNRVKEAASEGSDSLEDTQQFKEFVDEVTKKAQSNSGLLNMNLGDNEGWQKTLQVAEEYLKSIPGGEKALRETPSFNEFVDLTKKKGPEAERLAKETMQEISDVLSKRLDEAKKLLEEK